MEKHRFRWLGKKHDEHEDKPKEKKTDAPKDSVNDSVGVAIESGEDNWKFVFKALLFASILGIIYLIYYYGF